MDNLAEHERDKYRRMWREPAYRRWSPGEESVAEAIELFGSGSVIDFGCGEGGAVRAFRAAGFEAVGVDHVKLQPDVVTACLWDLPETLGAADYGFCADVMEHIPTEKVEPVLSGIASKVKRAVYFRISTVPDGMGQLIGEKLHLTVLPAKWWEARLQLAFGEADMLRETADHVVFACR